MSKKVVIFEDDAFLLDAYQLKLSAAPEWRTVVFANGEDALAHVKIEKPNIIILDLIMPKKSGIDILRELKADSATRRIPVVVASNIGQKATIDLAMSLGAADYFIKSDITITDLLEKCKKYV